MSTYCSPVDDAVDAIMNATKRFTKPELEKLLGSLYNAGYDQGRARGYEMAEIDGALDADHHFTEGYNAGRAECP